MTPTVLPLWLEFIKAVAPLLAALLAAGVGAWVAHKFGRIQEGIARRQAETAAQAAKTARTKLRLDLFDKRIAVYEAANTLIKKAARRQRITDDDRYEFFQGTKSAAWLFDEETARYITETIYAHAFDLVIVYEQLDEVVDELERKALRKQRLEMLDEFEKIGSKLIELMNPFFRFDEKAD